MTRRTPGPPHPHRTRAWLAVLLQCIPLLFIAGCEPLADPALRLGIPRIAPSFIVTLTLMPLLCGWGWGYLYLGRAGLFAGAWLTGFVVTGIQIIMLLYATLARGVSGRSAAYAATLDRAYLLIIFGVFLTSMHAVWLPRRSRVQH